MPRSSATEHPPTSSGKDQTQEGPVASGSDPMAFAHFYMTSDLRAATGLTRTHLDFYLREGVIIPTARTESGYLLFNEAELAVLRQVIQWRQDGVGVREIRLRLERATPADRMDVPS